MQKFINEYRLSKNYLFLSLCIFLLFILNIDITQLPDYGSYESIYSSGIFSSIALDGWEPFFIAINLLGNYFSISYENYRLILLSTSLILFYLSFLIIIRKEKKVRSFICNHNSQIYFTIRNYSLFVSAIVIFSLVIYMFEFYIIRIRGGLAISIFIFAFSVLWNRTNKISILSIIIAIILFFLSSQTHFSTFMMLSYLLLVPYFITKLYIYTNVKYKININYLIYTGMYLLSIIFLTSIVGSVGVSRIGVDSELNPVRFFGIAIVPLLIVSHMLKKKIFFLNPSKYNTTLDKIASFKDVYHYFVFLNYVFLLLNLVVLYFSGHIGMAGEAVVRISSLSYLSAFFIIVLDANKRYLYFWLIIMLTHPLFFLNTIYG